MDTRIIPRHRPSKSMKLSPIAQIAWLALKNNGSNFFFDHVRSLPQAFQAWILNDLAERVITLAKETPKDTKHRWWVILAKIQEAGYHIDDPDMSMLQIRLGRAGYLK